MNIQELLSNKLFAEYMEIIKQLYIIDDDFKTLCDDYCLIILSVEKLKMESLQNKLLEREYEDLSSDLENETLRPFVKNYQSCGESIGESAKSCPNNYQCIKEIIGF